MNANLKERYAWKIQRTIAHAATFKKSNGNSRKLQTFPRNIQILALKFERLELRLAIIMIVRDIFEQLGLKNKFDILAFAYKVFTSENILFHRTAFLKIYLN